MATTVDVLSTCTAPPAIAAELKVIVQPTAMMAEPPSAKTAPPAPLATFAVIVLFCKVMLELATAQIAPPKPAAKFELIVHSVTITRDRLAFTAPPNKAALDKTCTDSSTSSLPE